MQERRKFGRIPFGTSVTVKIQDKSWTGTLQDLSLKGAQACLETSAPENDSPCQFRIPLSRDLILEFQGVVTHTDGNTVGIHFTQTDPESFGHLFRLMELNTGDSEKIHKEIFSSN
jgi:PilZ domain